MVNEKNYYQIHFHKILFNIFENRYLVVNKIKILQENKKNEIFSQNKNQGFERCKPWFFVIMMF